MSADNWAICPRCKASREADLANTARAVADSYGKVPVEDFDAARARLLAAQAEPIRNTFREDYEIGIDEDEFYVIYKGGCSECDLSHEFRHEQRIGGAA